LLREGWREGSKVCKRTLANLSDWPAAKIVALRRVLRDEPLVAPTEAFAIERSLPHGHVEAVLAMMRRLGLDRLIAARRSRERDLAVAMIAEQLSPEQTVRSYKNLAQVERAFRTLKSLDLRIRPIHHRETRVRAHIFLCLLAYYVEWHLRRAWVTLLFDDEALPVRRAEHDPVVPAEPSAAARDKKAQRHTDDGLPLHSFATLIGELATRCRHHCRLRSDPDSPVIVQDTEPTALQARALELVRAFPVPKT
jgi:hypothetical protein